MLMICEYRNVFSAYRDLRLWICHLECWVSMAYPCRPFLQPSKARLVSHPEHGQHGGRFPLLSEMLNNSETVCLRFAGRDLPLYHSMPLQQSLPRRASALLIAKSTCPHIAVGSAFDHLWLG